MVEFHELKSHLLKDLSLFIDSLQVKEGSFYTYETSTDISTIKELIPYLKDVTTFYMKSPSGHETLGIGALQFFNTPLEISELEELMERHPKLEFLGALPFDLNKKLDQDWDGFNKNKIFLPRVLISRLENKTTIKINLKGVGRLDSLLKMNLLTEIESLFSFIHRGEPVSELQSEDLLTEEKDWNTLINLSLDEFKESSLEKVVLARGKKLTYKEKVDPNRIFSGCSSASNLYEFFFHIENGPSFISFTPEKLFSKHKDIIIVDSIAGTLAKTSEANGEELLHSQKDLSEHRFVSNFVKESLHNLSTDVEELFKEELLTLPKLHHIHSRFKGKLHPKTNFINIINQLHPTPAVGGLPKQSALDFISRNENLNRGLYAGPIGRISKELTEFAVGIRSLLVQEKSIVFFGGAGIVKESIPEKEWKETDQKIESVLCMM